MRSKRSSLALLAIVFAGPTAVLGQFATTVVDFSSATVPATNVLGPPNCDNATDFDNVGNNPGFVTVAFAGPIVDVAGNDVVLHLTGFQPGQQFIENFDFLATTDGITFTVLGSADPNDFSFAPGDLVQFGFDLAVGGLASAEAVQVRNGSIFLGTNSEGPDICGFEALHFDGDEDGVSDADDTCEGTALGAVVDANGCSDVQVDGDGDGVCDPGAPSGGPSGCAGSDNCPNDPNADQDDLDADNVGDVCDPDADGDDEPVPSDCNDLDPTIFTDAVEICTDGVDNNCNGQVDEQAAGADCDGDTVPNELDNCPVDFNEFQEDLDGDGVGDVCDDDIDGDGVLNEDDNCPTAYNPAQEDLDGDGTGDACDADADGDSLDDATDDRCLGTTTDPVAGLPSRGLGKNRWAEMDGNAQFDTRGSNPTGRMYTIFSTGGCNCTQIIAACGYGQGHTKFGCSNSVMDWWTGTYERDGEAPFQCKED